MRILWLCALFHYALAQVGFGTSYLRNSRLCHQWNCLNVKLGLPDALPPRDQYIAALRSLLPAEWHDVANTAIDVCYDKRTRRYTNTCPGQALMHCVMDNMIANCPDGKWRKEDGCAPVSSLAANKYMFLQSRYANLQKNIQIERRPVWFLQHYFSEKCCDIPDFFNATVLSECGFDSFMLYHMHDAQTDSQLKLDKLPKISSNHLRSSLRHYIPIRKNIKPKDETTLKVADFSGIEENEAINDPLDCCDLREFITPDWRSECGFRLSWNTQDRLVISENMNPATEYSTTTETTKVKKVTDVKIVPLSCDQETCIFRRVGVVSESGEVDTLALSRLLDKMAAADSRWASAKARAYTKCLSKPVMDYEADCEINKVLACTLDVLTENCPDAKKEDRCRHSSGLQSNITCQISSSKIRPRNRRQLCNVPDFIDHEILKECGVSSITRLEYAPETPAPRRGWLPGGRCKEELPSTTCIMRKMDVLNKYNFIDYFKLKDKLREFCQGAWYPMRAAYTAAFSSVPLYKEHCSSQQKLLNVLDTMLITCPISKRRQAANCKRMFTELSTTVPGYQQNINSTILEELLRRFQHVFLAGQIPHLNYPPPQKTVVYPRYKFNVDILSNMKEPVVRVIDVVPTKQPTVERKPLVLLPVYQRMQQNLKRPNNNDGVWRGYIPI
ncbi:unnamed protein product [Parnassius apollo]|uniref:(apollo) hypothetical protein n=1 Tax=Parnassius apollo TaxID=110799 RepID=A0A8S3WT97_PARAO|nr:unnamed protein product [Parnassius apollo]